MSPGDMEEIGRILQSIPRRERLYRFPKRRLKTERKIQAYKNLLATEEPHESTFHPALAHAPGSTNRNFIENSMDKHLDQETGGYQDGVETAERDRTATDAESFPSQETHTSNGSLVEGISGVHIQTRP
eukprot:GDKI01049151.1.p2 GENE.GDKI01049151.1~~GDKI01049151.1.p2  ORF type:complete len:129 (-),score=15.86 GDKI01049151.1:471-857(-)